MVLVAMVFSLGGSLVLYSHVGHLGYLANFLSMALVGFLLFGPDALVCSVAAQDLGGAHAAGTAAGAINGMGSVGAIFQGMVTAYIAEKWGWNALFQTFVWLALACAVILVPYAVKKR
jgi:sugar phosphate permease